MNRPVSPDEPMQLRDAQIGGPFGRLQVGLAIAVALVQPLRAALAMRRPAARPHVQLHEIKRGKAEFLAQEGYIGALQGTPNTEIVRRIPVGRKDTPGLRGRPLGNH